MKERVSMGRSAILLAVVGIIAKLIGALYRVPLTNIVGAEGMGLYQMVFPLYTVLLAFCGGGVTGAVSRVVAKYGALGNESVARRAIRVALVPTAVAAAVSVAAVALLRNVISGVQGNTEAGVAYLAICPSLLFAGVIGALRGYFQGRSQMLPGGVSQLIEQSVKLVLGLFLAKRLLPYGVKYAVAGALAGVTASEFCALAYLSIRYFFTHKRKRKISELAANMETSAEFAAAEITDRELLRELYSFALPVTLGSLVLPITQMIDSVLVINLLMHGGAVREQATALFGLFVGPVGTLINMPTVVVLSVSVAFLPTLTAAVSKGGDCSGHVRSAAKWIMIIVIPVTLAFLVFPERICTALYSRGLSRAQLSVAAWLLRVQALGVFYVGVLQLCTTMLQGHNKAHIPVINLVIGACVKVALTPILVRVFGIVGASCATAACYGTAALLTARRAYKLMPICAEIKTSLVVPLVFSVLGLLAFAGTTALAALAFPKLSALVQTAIGGVVFAAVYGAGVLYSLGAFKRMPFVKK